MRAVPPLLRDGRSATFQFLNTSKRSITLPADRRAALDTLLGGHIDAALYEEGDGDAATLLYRLTPPETGVIGAPRVD